MKYQKSTLKLYEYLIRNPKGFVLDTLIKSTKVGRTAAFQAIQDLHKARIINIESQGKQKIISLNPSPGSLKYKLFLDELKFRQLPRDIQFTVRLFSELISPNMVALFGSFAAGNYTNTSDIDILVSGNRDKILKARELAELLSNRIINTHFLISKKEDYIRLYQSICISGIDKYLSLLSKDMDKTAFIEAIEEINSAERNFNSDIFPNKITNAEVRLGYFIGEPYLSKKEVLDKLYKIYPKLKIGDKIKKLKVLKDVAREIGERVFD